MWVFIMRILLKAIPQNQIPENVKHKENKKSKC